MSVLCGFFHHRLLQLILCATGKTFAMIHDRDPRTDLLDLFHIMRSIKDRGALSVQFLDPLQYLVAALRIDGNGRLVHNDQPRPVRDSTGNIKPPQQSAGKLARTEMFEPLKPGKCDRILYELFAFLFGRYIESAEIVDILVYIHLCKYGNILRNNADQGIIQAGTVELTGNGKRLAEEYERSVQGMSRYLAGMTGKSPEDMTIEAMHMVLDLAPETRQSILGKIRRRDLSSSIYDI